MFVNKQIEQSSFSEKICVKIALRYCGLSVLQQVRKQLGESILVSQIDGYTRYRQGIWQDGVVRIRIIRLLPHPLHPWAIFPHKTRKLLHISEKATAYHPEEQK